MTWDIQTFTLAVIMGLVVALGFTWAQLAWKLAQVHELLRDEQHLPVCKLNELLPNIGNLQELVEEQGKERELELIAINTKLLFIERRLNEVGKDVTQLRRGSDHVELLVEEINSATIVRGDDGCKIVNTVAAMLLEEPIPGAKALAARKRKAQVPDVGTEQVSA